MVSILGKRSSEQAGLTRSIRSKRQLITPIYNDETENPRPVSKRPITVRDASSIELDELSDVLHIKVSPSQPTCGLQSSNLTVQYCTSNEENEENLKPIQTFTPQTPRNRDALSKKAPVTPRHRVMLTGKSLTPQTPRTPSSSHSLPTVYNCARQLFTRSSDPGRLVGRDEERTELATFITSSIDSSSGGCTYVSGPPGTGKSALVGEVVASIPKSNRFKSAYVNCMSMKTSKDIYATLLDLLCEDLGIMEGEEIHTLQGMFVPRRNTNVVYVVTLDEMDHILSLDLEFMYKLFEWSLQKSSQLVLIGIANALDLTDRFLPRLKARNLKPQLLPFFPYTASQIKAIITSRLKTLLPADSSTPEYVPFLHPAAIDLCSRKVAGQTGDLRKALDICRRAIDIIENETKLKHQQLLEDQLQASPSRKVLGENTNLSSPAGPSPCKFQQRKTLASSLMTLTVETAPRASISHVNKITAAVFSNGNTQRLKTLNLQQKAALCALVALEKKKRAALANIMATPSKSNQAAPTVKNLYNTYCMLCRRDSVLQPLTSTEFRDVIGSLETLSLISAVDGKNGSFVGFGTPSKRGRKGGFGSGVGSGDEKRVGSCVGEKELETAVEGLGGGILKSILSGEGLE